MLAYTKRLRWLVDVCTPRLLAFDAFSTQQRPAPDKWSPRELIGHLIDSASNNHRRFVRAQFRDTMVFHGYEPDQWVTVQHYNEVPWPELVALWGAFNRHLAHVMVVTPEEVRLRTHKQHNLDTVAWQAVPKGQPVTLDYFMADYVGHLEHHLRQLLGDDLGAAAVKM